MTSMLKGLLSALPASWRQRFGYALLRSSSEEFRAVSELFFGPYGGVRDWRSGLGSSGNVLFSLVQAQAPEVVLEIGSARGRSACCMAQACRMNGRGKVYAIDPHRANAWTDPGTNGETLEFFRDRLRDYGLEPWCEIIVQTSADAAKQWHRPIDFFFIDGDHTYAGVRQDFELFQPWLTPGALVAVHDTTWEYYKTHRGTGRISGCHATCRNCPKPAISRSPSRRFRG